MYGQDRPTLQPVTNGVFAWVPPNGGRWVENAGAIVTADGVILIDTGSTEPYAQGLLWAVAHATSGAPVTYAVNTHRYSCVNSLLPDHAVIIGHNASRAGWPTDLAADENASAELPPADEDTAWRPPTLTISTGLTLRQGSHEVEVLHPGYPAHTPGDLVAWLPRQGALFTGGLLSNQVTPVAYQGSVEGSLRALDWIACFAPDHVIPGHGPLIDASGLPEVLDTHRRYYQFVLDTAQAGVRDGLAPLEAARRCDLGAFADLPEPQRIVLNLHRAYADIVSGPLDMIRAITDTVAYNGRPIHAIN